MTRKEAKNMARSRDCKCIKGKDRDNNYAECIDKVFDWHERILENSDLCGVRSALIAFEESKHMFLSNKYRHKYAVKIVDNYLNNL